MLLGLADDAQYAIAADHFTLVTNLSYGWTDFHNIIETLLELYSDRQCVHALGRTD